MTQSDQVRALSEYVAGLGRLCSELSAGITALSENDISAFESRLESQQSICQQLTQVSRTSQLLGSLPEAAQSAENEAELCALKLELRKHQQELTRLNRQYASLLKGSEQTVSFLSLLCRSYAEGYGKTGPASNHSSLSCEG